MSLCLMHIYFKGYNVLTVIYIYGHSYFKIGKIHTPEFLERLKVNIRIHGENKGSKKMKRVQHISIPNHC